ncbi:Myb transcription factor [Hordeum vulgare]|nr:Myb transcription factor [Hordeum vulgare]
METRAKWLVIRLQAKHGNKWKKIATEVPGRTAKRLGKWWEVFKEKQQREIRDSRRPPPEPSPDERGRYEWLLENFTEKLVKERQQVGAAPLHHHLMAAHMLPPWMSSTATNGAPVSNAPLSPSITLSLASAVAAPPAGAPWMQQQQMAEDGAGFGFARPPPAPGMVAEAPQAALAELSECCRELDEGHRAWAAHRKEASWRLKRVELQLESERACRPCILPTGRGRRRCCASCARTAWEPRQSGPSRRAASAAKSERWRLAARDMALASSKDRIV